jgi:hypothetical protein
MTCKFDQNSLLFDRNSYNLMQIHYLSQIIISRLAVITSYEMIRQEGVCQLGMDHKNFEAIVDFPDAEHAVVLSKGNSNETYVSCH